MKNKIDFTKGDHSIKNWIKISWKNSYIQIAIVSLAIIVYQLFNLDSIVGIINENFYYGTMGGIITITAMLIPLSVFSIVSYKGLYKHWKNITGK